jgi:hypothetical protein
MIKIYIILILGVFISISLKAQWIQVGNELNGESTYDYYGYSTCLSSDGSIIAIGSPYVDSNGSNAGRVQIYKNINDTWLQIGEDIDGQATNDLFGSSISLNTDGTIIAIGAYFSDNYEIDDGCVQIYENINDTWVQIGEDIVGKATEDHFGNFVSLNSNGSIVAIGAFGNDENGSEAGQVRIFENINASWIQIGEDINGESSGDKFSGVSLSSNGLILAASAPFNDNNGSEIGNVKVFRNITGTWTQIGEDINGNIVGELSGYSISLSSDGTIIAIGAPSTNSNGSNEGHVRIFQNINNSWIQIGEDINGEAYDDLFGYSIRLNSDGSVVIISARNNNSNGIEAGRVQIYKNISNTWVQIDESIDGEAAGDHFGRSVSVNSDGNIIAVGALDNDSNGIDAGQVKIYKNLAVNIETNFQKSNSIYPNPTAGIIYFEFAINNIKKLTISDITGKQIIVKTEVQQNEQNDLSSFESGIYIISIQTDNEIFTYKIIKE